MCRELLIEKYIRPTRTIFRVLVGIYEVAYIKNIWVNKYEELHSVNGQPSLVSYKNNKKEFEFWSKNGMECRRDNKPFYIEYNEDGTTKTKRWFKEGRLLKEKNY